jgi:hypothetical protein
MQLSIKSSKNEKKKLLNFPNKNKIHLNNTRTKTNHYFSKKEKEKREPPFYDATCTNIMPAPAPSSHSKIQPSIQQIWAKRHALM